MDFADFKTQNKDVRCYVFRSEESSNEQKIQKFIRLIFQFNKLANILIKKSNFNV